MNLDYKNDDLAENPHKESLRRTEERIMMFIIAAQDGIGHLELARKVGINRINLTPHIRRLIAKGLVLRGRGKRGKYYPASKKYRDISITANIFSKVAAGTILAADGTVPIGSPYFDDKIVDKNTPLENALFTFSNGVGCIITYLLVQAMSPSNKIPGRDAENDEEKDINVNKWFKDGFSSLGEYLLDLFNEHIGSELLTYCNDYAKEGEFDFQRYGRDYLNYGRIKPSFTLDEKFISCIKDGLSRIYPSIYDQLEKINSQLPRVAAQEFNRALYRKVSYRQQKICNHDWDLPRNESLSAKYQNNVLHCRKCHKDKYIKNPYRKY
ncbi:MAG TPA: winged helix-turn-helix domain-containing protein [Nitrososphaeraceae archaeon]